MSRLGRSVCAATSGTVGSLLAPAHVCNLTEHEHDTHQCCCGYVWTVTE